MIMILLTYIIFVDIKNINPIFSFQTGLHSMHKSSVFLHTVYTVR